MTKSIYALLVILYSAAMSISSYLGALPDHGVGLIIMAVLPAGAALWVSSDCSRTQRLAMAAAAPLIFLVMFLAVGWALALTLRV